MRRLRALFCTAVLLLSGFTLSGCKEKTLAGKGFRFPLSAEPRQIDPQVSTDSASVTLVAALFEGLARLDESSKPVPAAADWTISENRKVYTFTLRKSKWSNDEPVTAHDFVFGMQRAVSPDTRSSLAEQLFDIRGARAINEGKASVDTLGVRALSDTVLEITLNEPNEGFLAKTTTTPFMPCQQAFFEETAGRYGLDADLIITNGPFFLKRWNHHESLLLNKHEGYHDASDILPAAVRYVIGSTEDVENIVYKLTEGLLDAAPIGESAIAEAKAAGLTMVSQQDTIQYLWFNNGVSPLSSAAVRRTLRSALEWDLLKQQMVSELHKPAAGFVAPDALLTGAERYRTEKNALSFEPAGKNAHQALLTALADSGVSRMPTLTVLCADDTYSTNLARYIVQSWQRNLSVYFTIEAVPSDTLNARLKVGNYQIAIGNCMAPGWTALDALGSFTTDAPGNYARFTNSAYDKQVQAAWSGTPQRGEIEKLEHTLWDACPAVPLTFVQRYVAIPAYNSGIVVRSFGGGAFGAPIDFRFAGRAED